jgi:hypothetical protein
MIPNFIFANHEGLGFELSSKYISSTGQHILELKHFRSDAQQGGVLSSYSVALTSSCGSSTLSLPLRNSDSLNTNCSANKIYVYNYFDTLSLNLACKDFNFSLSACCFSSGENRGGAIGADLYLKNDSIVNNSPSFNSRHFLFAALNDTNVFDFSAKDLDGDSLSYELYASANSTTNYYTGYTFLKPFGLNSFLALNSRTGFLKFEPIYPGKYMIGIKVNEYRNGRLIGFTTKDIVCFFNSGLNRSLTWANPSVLTNVCIGDTISLFGNVSGPQSTTLIVSMFADSSNAFIVNNGNTVGFNWIVQPIDSGLKTFNIFIEDGNCNVKSSLLSVNVTNCLTTSIEENLKPEFDIYPNPACEILNIRLKGATNSQVQVLNLKGELIDLIYTSLEKSVYDVSRLKNGIYFLRIQNEDIVLVKKFVICKK